MREFFEGIAQLWFLIAGFQTGTALLRAYDFACQVRFSLDGRIGPYEENLRPVFIRPGKEDILFPFRCNRQAIPDGIDFCMTALFVIIFIDQWEKTKNHVPALIGLGTGIICLLFFGKSNFILPALIIASGILLLWQRKEKNEVHDEKSY